VLAQPARSSKTAGRERQLVGGHFGAQISHRGVIADVNRHPVLQLLAPCRVLSAGIEHKHTGKETHMNTLTTKLAALAGTLVMNTLVMGAVAYCFALQPNTYMTAVALAKAVATQQGLG
jgi:hypothetical protein